MLHMVIVMDQTQLEKYKALGLKISYYRRKRELTQEQLAEKLDVSRQSISKWESGLYFKVIRIAYICITEIVDIKAEK